MSAANPIVVAAVHALLEPQNPGNYTFLTSNDPDAYNLSIPSVTTLVFPNDRNPNSAIQDLLFVPTPVNPSNCSTEPSGLDYLAQTQNVTAKSVNVFYGQRPLHGHALIPWLDDQRCLWELINSAIFAQNAQTIITYLANNTTLSPPSRDSGAWRIGGSQQWMNQFDVPVFAISMANGTSLMNRLKQDSLVGNQFNTSLTASNDSWLYATIQPPVSYSIVPDLWTIVLAVLAAFVAVLAVLSGIMHVLQRRRRRDLRRRIAAGEVDLAALGVRKLTVPADILQQIPVRRYGELCLAPSSETHAEAASPQLEVLGEKTAASAAATVVAPTASNTAPATSPEVIYSQPTCAICIDDYESDTEVRLLPCNHIFHTACVDPFFLETSCLCPICKKSVLPRGYCPTKVTNAMVRRERIAQLQAQEAAGDAPRMRFPFPLHGASLQPRRASTLARLRSTFAQQPAPDRPVELTETAPTTTTTTTTSTTNSGAPPGAALPACPSDNMSRREWTRLRAVQMLGHQPHDSHGAAAAAIAEEDEAQQRRVPGWRRALARVFPMSSHA